MKAEATQFPPNWISASLSDVCDIISGYGFPESLQGRTEGAIPFYKVGDISEAWKNGRIHLSKANHYLTQKEADSLNAKPLPPSTTVFAKIGAAIALNRRAMLSVPALVDNNVMGLHPKEVVLNSAYLFYFVCTLRLNDISQATTVPSIRKSDVERIQLPLPPLGEQTRIVSEVEKQFTRLDAAVAALKRIQANLKQYRAAILKAACEGRLVPTEAELARREGRSYEPASVLLERILAERRSRWEAAQVAKSRVSSRDPKNDDWKKKYDPPENLGAEVDLAANEGWGWATVEQLTTGDRTCSYGVLQPGDDVADGVLFIRVGDIDNGRVAASGIKRIAPQIAEQYPRTLLQGGEILITLVGAIGRTAVVPESLAGANTARAVGVIPATRLINARWLELWLRNPQKVNELTGQAHEVARKTLNLEDVRKASVALPPVEEQNRIATEVDRRLSVVDEVEAEVEAGLKRADRLRQAILKLAFEGHLVSQNPNDEPANVLLERIRGARNAVQESIPTFPRTRRKKEAAHVA